MRTIAVAHHKGGTAKTTTTVNLAAALAEAGHRVLVIDMDPQGSASAWLGVRDPEYTVIDAIRDGKDLAHLVYETTAPGVQLVPASPELIVGGTDEETNTALGFIKAMERLAPLWDFVLVDCPPSLGYLGVAPLAACDEVLIPVEAHVLAVAGLSSLMETIGRVSGRLNPRLKITGVLACRVDNTSHSRMVVERLGRRFPRSFMQTQIRESVRLAEAPSFREPITTFAPESRGAEDYRALAAEIAAPVAVRVAPAGATVKVTVPAAEPGPSAWSRFAGMKIRGRTWAQTLSLVLPLGVLAIAAFVRLWQLDAVGFNTDEAVYSGQAAALANDPNLTPFFPIFRAHPLLFQFALADVFSLTGVSALNARIVSAAAGVLTVYVVYRLGRLLYDRPVGLIAALLLALMPYHVIVTRQVLLDGPMTLFATLALYTVAKYAITGERTWLYATGAAMGLTFLSKETSVILLGAIFAFFALSPADQGADPRPGTLDRRVRVRRRGIPARAAPGGKRGRFDGAAIPHLAALPATEPRRGVLPADGPHCRRSARHRGGDPRAVALPAKDRLAGAAAPRVDRRDRHLLRAMAGQGLPVPPSRGASPRHPCRARDRRPLAIASPALDRRRPRRHRSEDHPRWSG